ncbi:peptidoglycan DD-metalloendopeptidase family protein [Streptomyces scabiei]|uniref:peptidoglycan DD-metalloendopeptidase family protein n=2 Tax=Streptomyces scabiei TaxID=1930 RepID=UPI0029AF4B44|nr:peptidoglycan DD-metalloendopeptidase family protein [Streptomyces scabiei]MDX3124537.1 peptidoglycan DD-metalloendopeptidase family protein [Streptomyces scabiei]
MAEATVVGRTRVSLIPDVSQFGDRLRVELPSAIRQPAKDAGDLAGDLIRNAISKKLAKPIGVKVKATLDDKAATTALRRLTDDRTVKITAELDDKAATAGLVKLTQDRKVKITAELDDTGAKAQLGALSGQQSVDILPKVQQAAYNTAKKQLDRLTADRVVNIRASVDTRVAANEISNLIRRRTVRIGADVDTRVAANDLANLTRRRTVTVQARADTAAADASLRFLTRDRTVNVRVRSTGLAALTLGLSSLGSGGGGGGGVGLLSSRIVMLTGAAISALPTIGSLGSALAQLGPLAATGAPALSTLIGLVGTLKLGTLGVGDAIKAAFNPVASEATKAATATRQVETAQRQLANAQRGVADAERSLTQAQRTARLAQAELSAARREAARALEDMNAQLKQGALDQKQAALDVEQAELDLAQTRSDPTATQLQIRQGELALERARANAEEQARQQKRLATDTKAANKAGVDGSEQVLAVRERIRQTGEQVAEAQRQLADAHRAVADAARQVADAQTKAATQTTKLDTALAKLSPNARQFVGVLQSMAPAWRDMRLEVQDRLFGGLGTRLERVGTQILPTVRTGLAGTAGELNTMGRNALTAVSNLERTGQLTKVFDGIQSSLGNLSRIPGQLVTGLGQLSIAAQPAFDRITSGAASAMDRVMAKLSKGLESGTLAESINTALDVAVQFGGVLADIFGIVKNIMGAAAAGGGDFFAVIGTALEEIRRITALPEVQESLRQIFTAIQAIATLVAGALGSAIQAALPLLATLAPFVVEIAGLLGPAIGDLLTQLGVALMPVAKNLGPVLVGIAKAAINLVEALSPLLPVAGELLASLLPPLLPLVDALAAAFLLAAPVIRQVAGVLGAALKPIIAGLAVILKELVTQGLALFTTALQTALPILPMVLPHLLQLGVSFGQILTAVAPLIPQITMMGAQFLLALLPALIPLIPPLVQLSTLLLRLATWLIVKIVVPALTKLVNFLAALRKAFQPAVDAVKWLTEKIAGFFSGLYDFLLGHSIIPDIVNGTLGWFRDMGRRTVKIFTDLKDGAIRIWSDFWAGVRSTATDAWRKVRSGFDAFSSGLRRAFRDARNAIGEIWAGLKNLVKEPIKFWIETVYNRGIVTVWNSTAAKIPGVPDLQPMTMPKGFARGGILAGDSHWWQGDDQLVPMRRGEGVYVSEVMRDPYERARLHAMNQAAIRGVHPGIARSQYGFAGGGIIGDIGSGLKNIGSNIADSVTGALGKGADAVRGRFGDLAAKALKPVKAGITKALGTNTSTWPGMVARAPLNLIDRAVDYIRGKDIPDSTGAWMKPVKAAYGTRFGTRGLMWSSGRHTGLDFPARTGTRVSAVDNGTVKSAQSGGPYGKHVLINHGGNLQSLYAHMSSIAAKVGAGITRGAKVGAVGATGNVTGPHLHLEARVNGRAVDPMKYLTASGGDGGTGVQRWRGVVEQALGQVRQSLSLADTTLRRMKQESGGNPRVVNRWDSNWKAGHPSVGLMQVIRGTFRAYAGKYKNTGPFMYGVSVDPMANIYASMRYALKTYGSLSRAYNRPGGYARGGVVGGVRIGRGLPRGYATGGIIRVGGKRIDTGPIAASVGGDFLKKLTSTAAQISAAMTQVANAVKNAFKGVKTTIDNKLLAKITASNVQLQALAKQRDAIAAKISAAHALAAEATQGATQFTQLTSLPNNGGPFGATGILNGLNTRLAQLKAFGKNLQLLAKRGLSKALLQQIIGAGPDGGAAYAQALVDATPQQLKDINAAQASIAKAATAYGQDAADSLYDAGSQSGKGYLAGLRAQEKAVTDALSVLAKKIKATIEKALKIKSPSQVFARLGAFTVQGFAQGMRAATPQAAATAARMAAIVRSSAGAGGTRVGNTIANTTVGDRVLNYNATVREQASRASILAALALEDQLHRPVVVGA